MANVQHDKTEIIPLDGSHAQAVGALPAQTGTSDIVDAHVAICAQTSGFAVVTSDPVDLRRLDPQLRLIAVYLRPAQITHLGPQIRVGMGFGTCNVAGIVPFEPIYCSVTDLRLWSSTLTS